MLGREKKTVAFSREIMFLFSAKLITCAGWVTRNKKKMHGIKNKKMKRTLRGNQPVKDNCIFLKAEMP